MACKDTPSLDFRSDTITRPTPGMRAALAAAEVGDDYYRDDPTVQELEKHVASLMGKESALFTPSGTQSNLIAVMTHCRRGDSYIVGDASHSYLNELGGVAVVAGVLPQVVRNRPDGRLDLEDIRAALPPVSILRAPVRLIALENTIGGKVLPLGYMQDVADLARQQDLRIHLDGARVLNAACALDVPVSEIARHCDTLSLCLSKGLGAPVGSVLAGTHAMIEEARRHRQMLGGGLRQAGILAAAGLYALENHITRLADDHMRAQKLAEALSRIPGLRPEHPQSNIVFCDVAPDMRQGFADFLSGNGLVISGTAARNRWVTHLGIDDAKLDRVLSLLTRYREHHRAA